MVVPASPEVSTKREETAEGLGVRGLCGIDVAPAGV